MLFLAKHNIRIPKVYAVFYEKLNSVETQYYLVMEYIDGKTLEEVGLSLDDITIESINTQLKNLRSIHQNHKEPMFSRVFGQGWLPPAFSPWNHLFDGVCGPFTSYNELTAAMSAVTKHRIAGSEKKPSPQAQYFLRNFERSLLLARELSQRPVLTHLNFTFDNILLESSPDGYVPVLISWRHLGWYPAWTELASIYNQPKPSHWAQRGYKSLVAEILNGIEEPVDLTMVFFIAKCMKLLDYTFL